MHATTQCEPTAADRGSAMIMTLMIMALVTALATTVATLTIDNLQSSWRAQQAGTALNAADAGVSQATSYLRSSGVRKLNCSPSCPSGWASSTNPTAVDVGSAGARYRTWIEAVRPYPTYDPGKYRIHSTGLAPGAASRTVVVDVSVTTDATRAVFARSINGGGSTSLTRESVISTGCVYQRDKIHMVPGELDAAYGIPIGVHSSQYITESNGTGQYCPATDNKLIHKDGPCASAFHYDHDRLGGDLTSTGCSSAATTYPSYFGNHDLDGDGVLDVKGSYIRDDAALRRLFNLKSPVLSQARIDQLRAVARAQGNYWNSATTWTSPDEADAVMFFELTGPSLGGTVNLNNVTGFGRAGNLSDTAAGCPSKSLVIVIEGGNADLNSNQQLYASLFLTSGAPNGIVTRANGTANFIGTIYADTVNLVGNVDISLDPCFLSNLSPSLLDVQVTDYREDDRGLS